MINKIILIYILLLNLPNRVFADIYKWKDEKGNVHITNEKKDIHEKNKNQVEKPLEKKEKIITEEGYMEIIETHNSFEMTQYIKDNNSPTGYKTITCFESGNTKTINTCKDLYNKIISQPHE